MQMFVKVWTNMLTPIYIKLKYLLHQIFTPNIGFGVNSDLGLKK